MRPYRSESSPNIGAAINVIIPASAVTNPAIRNCICEEYPVRRKEGDDGSVKIIGKIGIIIPIPTISRSIVKNKIGRAFLLDID